MSGPMIIVFAARFTPLFMDASVVSGEVVMQCRSARELLTCLVFISAMAEADESKRECEIYVASEQSRKYLFATYAKDPLALLFVNCHRAWDDAEAWLNSGPRDVWESA